MHVLWKYVTIFMLCIINLFVLVCLSTCLSFCLLYYLLAYLSTYCSVCVSVCLCMHCISAFVYLCLARCPHDYLLCLVLFTPFICLFIIYLCLCSLFV